MSAGADESAGAEGESMALKYERASKDLIAATNSYNASQADVSRLQREIADSGRAYAEIGTLWLQAEQALARLPETDRHVPVGDATLKTDVQDAVAHRFTALVDELKPQVQRAAEAGSRCISG